MRQTLKNNPVFKGETIFFMGEDLLFLRERTYYFKEDLEGRGHIILRGFRRGTTRLGSQWVP